MKSKSLTTSLVRHVAESLTILFFLQVFGVSSSVLRLSWLRFVCVRMCVLTGVCVCAAGAEGGCHVTSMGSVSAVRRRTLPFVSVSSPLSRGVCCCDVVGTGTVDASTISLWAKRKIILIFLFFLQYTRQALKSALIIYVVYLIWLWYKTSTAWNFTKNYIKLA